MSSVSWECRRAGWVIPPHHKLVSGALQKLFSLLLFTKKDILQPNINTIPGNLLDFGPGCMFTGVNWWDGFSTGEIPNVTISANSVANPYDPNGPDGADTAVHAQKANFAFADGHIKAMTPTATEPDPVNQPQNNMWAQLGSKFIPDIPRKV